jgi:two-component system, LytTR family, response regulator
MSNHQSLAFPFISGTSKFFIKKEEILYCSAFGSYTNIFCTEDRKFCISKRLKVVESLLGCTNIQRCHHSFAVNIDYIRKIIKDDHGLYHIILEDDTVIDLSRRKQKKFIEMLMKFNP